MNYAGEFKTNDNEEVLDYQKDDIPPHPSYSSTYFIDHYNDFPPYQSSDNISERIIELLAKIGNWIAGIDDLIYNGILIIIGLVIWPLGLFFLICLVCSYIKRPDNEILIRIGFILLFIGIFLIVYFSIIEFTNIL